MNEFFKPKTIALIGASNKKGKIGNDIYKNLKNSKSKIIPINVKQRKFGFKKSLKSVKDYSKKIDLAIIVIPSKFVENALNECYEKKIKNIIIISAGFAESGNFDLELRIKKLSKKYNMNIIGPNCLGIINTFNSLNASFFNSNILKGGISFISQSGAIGVSMLDKSINENIGFSKFISIGNMVDVDFADCINYLNNDSETKVIGLYIEGIKNGEKFINAVKKCKKPIVVLKSGVSDLAVKAIESHTGSLAGNSKIMSSVFKQFNIIQVHNLNELMTICKFFNNNPLPKSKKVCVITNAGGLGVLSVDACENNNLTICKLPLKIKKELNKVLPAHWSNNNPIDILGDALSDRYESTLNIISNKNFYDILLFILTPQSNTEPVKSINALIEFKKNNPNKSIFVCLSGGKSIKKALKIVNDNNLINFDEPYFFAKTISRFF